MPRFSITSHCQICGKEIAQSGPARAWVHLNEFYAKADHAPVPRENVPYTLPKPATPAPAAAADGAKGLGAAELRRRLRTGARKVADQGAARVVRRRAAEPPAERKGIDVDEAARRLRRLRLGNPPDQGPDGH